MSVVIKDEDVRWFEDMWALMNEMYEAGEYEFGDDAACDIANKLHAIILNEEEA